MSSPSVVVNTSNARNVRPMEGRDPNEVARASTPLELLFDLTFVIAFSIAGDQFAHLLSEGHFRAGGLGFGFAMFAVVWAWINFTWFASAYDTDDWVFRLMTMLQMVGVLILAIGLPAMFHSIDEGHQVNNRVMVLGYIVMRVAMVSQWMRAAKQDPLRRATCLSYVKVILIAQIGWVLLVIVQLSIPATLLAAFVLGLLELAGPYLAEKKSIGTPWHPHHVAERYGLMAIIALGEVLLGTVASLSAVIEDSGWTWEVVVVGLAGVGLAFSMWWVYFLLSAGDALHHHRDKAFRWGYSHVLVFASIAAVGAGLHVAAYSISGESPLSAVAVVLIVAIPVTVFAVALSGLTLYLLGRDNARDWPPAANLGLLLIAIGLAKAGVTMVVCLAVVALSPAVGIVADVAGGNRSHA